MASSLRLVEERGCAAGLFYEVVEPEWGERPRIRRSGRRSADGAYSGRVLEARAVDPLSLVRFENVLLTKAAVAQFEEILA